MNSGPHKGRSPGVKDWALLAVSLAFCVLSLLVIGRNWRVAVVNLMFFGGCALVFGFNIRRKLREQRLSGAQVSVVGGVDICANGPQIRYIALGCFLVGTVIFFVGVDFPWLMRLLGAFVALAGIALAVAVALGFFQRSFIRFEPDGVIFGERRYRFRVDWDNIDEVFELDYADSPFVGVQLRDVLAVSIEPPARAGAFLARVKHNQALMNVDVLLSPGLFGIDGPVLAGALHRYAQNPEARDELAQRALPGSRDAHA